MRFDFSPARAARKQALAAATPAARSGTDQRVSACISLLTASGLGRLLGVPPPQRRNADATVFGQGVGPAETVPAGGAHLAIGPLRNDIVIPDSTRSSALVAATRSERLFAKITWSIIVSTAGFLIPIRLSEPGWSAACEPQKPRCSLPWWIAIWPTRGDDVVVPTAQAGFRIANRRPFAPRR